VKTALAARLLINVTNDNVIRLLPPLVISSDEAEQLVNLLSPLITDFLTRVPAGVPARKSA
jgi:acetylornithine aminotransferase